MYKSDETFDEVKHSKNVFEQAEILDVNIRTFLGNVGLLLFRGTSDNGNCVPQYRGLG